MKIKYDKNQDQYIDENKKYLDEQNSFNKKIRTNFFKSLLFLFFELFIPIGLVWCFTSNDFSFSYKVPIGISILLAFLVLIFSFSTSLLTYILKWHKTDQISYTFSLAFSLITLYLSGFWWHQHFLYRVLLTLGVLIFAMFIGTFISFIIYNSSLKKYK